MNNTPLTFFKIVMILIFFLLMAMTTGSTWDGETDKKTRQLIINFELTPLEKAWLKNHPVIRIGGPRSFPPFHYFEGKDELLKGISADYIFSILNQLGVKVEVQKNLSWPQVLKRARAGQIDLIPCTARTLERDTYLNFSRPYLSFPLVIISRNDASFIGGIDDLHGKKLTVIPKNSIVEWLARDKINFIPFHVESPFKALEAVSLGRADAHIENLAAAGYLIQKKGLVNLKVAAPTPYGNYDLYMGVRKDWPELLDILNKALGAMRPDQHMEIRNKWLSIRYEHGITKADVLKWMALILFCSGTILTVFLIWNRKLAKEIFERKKAQEEKIKAQKLAGEQKKLALVGQIAGKIAHDFNNILGIIMGNIELLLMDCKDPGMKKSLELIFDQTIRGKNLTKNLVAFAKNQEPRQEFFSIRDKVNLVLNLLKKDLEGIELIREEKSGVPDLLADPGMIEHALVNLVQNSIHAVSRVESPKIIVRTYSSENQICFEIEDNGCGIPSRHLENIYEPSFTLKGGRDLTGSYKPGIKGTGYGMSNIKKYIELHRGRIFVESTFKSHSDSGTKFTICLPVISRELTLEEKNQVRKDILYSGQDILLVEDESAISDVQYRILTQEPCCHRVDIAQNGQAAMDLFQKNHYDLVSLDYLLPGEMNGVDVYHHIRKTNKNIPIVFVSGNITFLESIKDLKQKDAYIDHLSKPCSNKDYVAGINKLFVKLSNQQMQGKRAGTVNDSPDN